MKTIWLSCLFVYLCWECRLSIKFFIQKQKAQLFWINPCRLVEQSPSDTSRFRHSFWNEHNLFNTLEMAVNNVLGGKYGNLVKGDRWPTQVKHIGLEVFSGVTKQAFWLYKEPWRLWFLNLFVVASVNWIIISTLKSISCSSNIWNLFRSLAPTKIVEEPSEHFFKKPMTVSTMAL